MTKFMNFPDPDNFYQNVYYIVRRGLTYDKAGVTDSTECCHGYKELQDQESVHQNIESTAPTTNTPPTPPMSRFFPF